MERHYLETRRTARYFTLGENEHALAYWLVLHGYGQQAEFFIRHFEGLDNTSVIAPEGLSRFYLDGLGGRTGASWMTALEREAEIADQACYLNTVLKTCVPKDTNPVLLGFSQGATAAVRWAVNHQIKLRALIVWAGSLPHDIPMETISAYLKGIPVHFVLGTRDQFIKEEDFQSRLGAMRLAIPHLRLHRFDGEHVMHGPTLAAIAKELG